MSIFLIKQIPLSLNSKQDKWVWSYEKKTVYTVASGYKVAIQALNNAPLMVGDVWSLIWKATVPSKVKYFAWRFSLDLIPCATNLLKKNVNVPLLYPFYVGYDETAVYLLLQCQFSRQVWVMTKIGDIQVDSISAVYFREALSWLGR